MPPHSVSVSVIVPCRNECRFIEAFCASVLAQSLPAGVDLQLVIADGMSDDGTRDLLTSVALAEPRIEWVDNPRGIVSTGLNQALRHATGDVIVRMDVHTEYAQDYIAQCLAALAESGADNVGGPWRAQAEAKAGAMQHAIVAAFQSRWVAGGARSRQLDYSGWADTVYLGCWPRASLTRFGGFDEALVRNQDDEHNLRICKGGGRIWQSERIRSFYHPRTRLGQVLRQYMQYGYWKPFVMTKHSQAAALRQLAPSVFVVLLAVSLVVALTGVATWPVLTLAGLYTLGVLVLTAAVVASQRPAWPVVLRIPAVIGTYHLGYGVGSIAGWCDALRGGPGRERFTKLTR